MSVTDSAARRSAKIALLVSLALVLSWFERLLPIVPIPGVKLGLANLVSLLAILTLRFSDAGTVLIVRIVLAGFFSGSPVSFLYSFIGGMSSFFVMTFFVKRRRQPFSLVGISLLGAFVHNSAQAVVLAFLVGSFSIAFSYYPVLIYAAIGAGLLVGLIIEATARHLHLVK